MGFWPPRSKFQQRSTPSEPSEMSSKKRTDANRILKEREKKMLSGEGYQRLEVDLNNKQFLQPVDTENTKTSVYYIRQKFIRDAHKTWEADKCDLAASSMIVWMHKP